MQCSRTDSLDVFFQDTQLTAVPKIAVVGCGCSAATIPVAEISHYWNITQVFHLESVGGEGVGQVSGGLQHAFTQLRALFQFAHKPQYSFVMKTQKEVMDKGKVINYIVKTFVGEAFPLLSL